MPSPESLPDYRGLVGASLLSGSCCALAVLTVGWARLLSTSRYPTAAGDVAFSVLYGGAVATVLFAAYLLAVLVVVADPSPRNAAGGAVLVYTVDLAVTVWQSGLVRFPTDVGLAVLAVPLPRVATLLAVATAVWFAYHDGYERLAAAAGDADQHPLFASVADRQLAPALSARRALVSVGLGGLISAGGLVAAGWFGDVLQNIGRPESGDVTRVVIRPAPFVDVGIPLDQLPVEWLVSASFLLAVLFVTGPRLEPLDLLKGVGVVLLVQGPLALLSASEFAGRAGPLAAVQGASPALVEDVVLLAGIAVAVWLAYHGGLETVQYRPRSGTLLE